MKINTLDLNFFVPSVISSFLIETPAGPLLIETGPDTTFPTLERLIGEHGYTLPDIKDVFVTHIHLDHSGAAWHLAETGSTIHVHPRGAPHLISPERLMQSARMIYEDQMDELWGTVNPIPEALVHAMGDGETVSIGGLEIRAIETPGHASHHNAYLIEDHLFLGDVGGIKIAGGPVYPPTPPPDINIELWQDSIAKIRELDPAVLHPTHFGTCTGTAEHLDELEHRLLEFTEWIGTRLREGSTDEEMIPLYDSMARAVLAEAGMSPEHVKAYELADPFWMNVSGLTRYWKKFRQPK